MSRKKKVSKKTSKQTKITSSRKAQKKAQTKKNSYGDYIVLKGQELALKEHPTDFSVLGNNDVSGLKECADCVPLAQNMFRATASKASNTDGLMAETREHSVAHHIYLIDGTDDEIIIDDRIFLDLEYGDESQVKAIAEEFSLVSEGRLGSSYVLKVTSQTGENPLKTANKISQLPGVAACTPQIMLPMVSHNQPALFGDQWYLSTDFMSDIHLRQGADIQAPQAWEISKGDPNIVVAVIDDGFDLSHPAFNGSRIHPAARDFRAGDSLPLAEDRVVRGFNRGD